MAAAPTPDANDLSGLSGLVEWFRGWLAPMFAGGAFGVAYFGGRKVQAVEGTQVNHTEILARHAAEIENLRKAQNDASLQIAKLPTREDLRDLTQTMQAQIQVAVSQIGQMIASGNRGDQGHHR